MKKFLLLLCAFLTTGCAAQNFTTPSEVSKLLEQGAVLVDVRTEDEFESGHLERAVHLPYQNILDLPDRIELEKDTPIVVYCQSGRRSGIAKETLVEAGYTRVFNAGGYEGLKGKGL